MSHLQCQCNHRRCRRTPPCQPARSFFPHTFPTTPLMRARFNLVAHTHTLGSTSPNPDWWPPANLHSRALCAVRGCCRRRRRARSFPHDLPTVPTRSKHQSLEACPPRRSSAHCARGAYTHMYLCMARTAQQPHSHAKRTHTFRRGAARFFNTTT